LGPYGYPLAETPIYDRLAAEGTTFLHAYSSCPLTIPSHSTIFTGMSPPAHGVRDNGDFVLAPSAVTLAERFRDAGYRTRAATAAFPTQRRWGLAQGFEEYRDPLTRLPTALDWRDERPAEQVVGDMLEMLDEAEGPMFAWVHLFDAHWPYAPPEPFSSRHAGRAYDGEIAYAASEVERLIRRWDQHYPESVVVITADHGEGLGDGGEQTHGFLLHDGTLHVPLIVRTRGFEAGFEAGARVADPVGHVDLAPTLLALAGLSPDAELEGRDLRMGGSTVMYAEALTGQFNLGLAPLHSWTDATGRFTKGAWGAFYPRSEGGRVSVVAQGDRPELQADEARLEAIIGGFGDAPVADGGALDAESRAALEALGYLGGDPNAPAGVVDPRDVIGLIPLTWEVRAALGRRDLETAANLHARLQAGMGSTFGVALLGAQLAAARGELAAAEEQLVDLFLQAPSSTLALQVGDLAAHAGDWRDAELWYGEALALSPMNPEAMGGRVRALLAQGLIPWAEEAARLALMAYPDHAEVGLMLAAISLSEGRIAEARREAEAALVRMPRDPVAWSTVAHVRWEAGDAEAAIEAGQESLRLAPLDLPTRLRQVGWLLEVGRAAEAVRLVEPLARLWPEDALIAAIRRDAQAALAAERAR
jgi:tetratricopeptide (TPR) repeat protein